MFFKLIESFDIYSNSSLEKWLFNSSAASSWIKLYHEIFFNKVRWVMAFIFFFALVIFYINLKNKKNVFFFNTFLSGFNNQLKTALFFKKINFLNWMFSLFLFILLANILGLIPETIALNSIFFVTIFLSMWMSFTYNFYGISIKKELWFNLFLPANIPFLITPMLCIIEIISYFIRILSLAIRLFANILAGHILLHLLISYLGIMIKSFNFYLLIFSIFFFILIFFLILLEWFMAFMQAAIFILLLSMWFNENII